MLDLLIGNGISDCDSVRMTFDATSYDDSGALKHAALVGFISADSAIFWSHKTKEVNNKGRKPFIFISLFC